MAAPNKFYEAAMVGTPVIASRFPEMEAVLKCYNYGLLVNPESVKEISEALLYLYEDQSAWEKVSRAGLEASHTELNWEKESENLKRHISKLVKKLHDID